MLNRNKNYGWIDLNTLEINFTSQLTLVLIYNIFSLIQVHIFLQLQMLSFWMTGIGHIIQRIWHLLQHFQSYLTWFYMTCHWVHIPFKRLCFLKSFLIYIIERTLGNNISNLCVYQHGWIFLGTNPMVGWETFNTNHPHKFQLIFNYQLEHYQNRVLFLTIFLTLKCQKKSWAWVLILVSKILSKKA